MTQKEFDQQVAEDMARLINKHANLYETDHIECYHCEGITHIGGLVGKQTNNCPRCDYQILFKRVKNA